MTATEQGRQAFRDSSWAEAFTQLSAAEPLDLDDVERLATAAHLTGRDSTDLWTRAYRQHAEQDPRRAARCAFWLTFILFNRGETARGGGWLNRAEQLLDGLEEGAEHGLVLLPHARRQAMTGDCAAAVEICERAITIGLKHAEPDLVALGRHVQARALIRLGRSTEAVALLDELMVAVTAGEVSPIVAGVVFCGVIEACQEAFDLRRAGEWTAALTRWCDAQPDLVPYTGRCQVHRSEILQLHGAWPDAADAARQAAARFALEAAQPMAGAAHYQLAELHRLAGEHTQAEQEYRQANRFGWSPQPGLALLRLAQGRPETASSAISRAVEDAPDPPTRCRLLPALVEVMLATDDLSTARAAAHELVDQATRHTGPLLHALAATATGMVLLAEGAAPHAELRLAWTAWQDLDVPYEAARVRVLIGRACLLSGDEDTARMELDAAAWVFQQLGAVTELGRVARLTQVRSATAPGGLTARETEVLRLVAAGRTNRAVATELFLSEKTVARHVANIFAKLAVSTRSAATAWAYEQRLV